MVSHAPRDVDPGRIAYSFVIVPTSDEVEPDDEEFVWINDVAEHMIFDSSEVNCERKSRRLKSELQTVTCC